MSESHSGYCATLTDALDDRLNGGVVFTFPDAGECLTWDELRRCADRVAAGLVSAGVASGDVVGLLVDTGNAMPVALFGIWRAGAAVTVLPTSASMPLEQRAEHVVRIVERVGLRHLIADRAHAGLARAIMDRRPAVSVLDPVELARSAGSPSAASVSPDDVAVVQFTSGSTNAPKGVVLTHRSVLVGLRAITESAAVTTDDVFVQWVPHYHDMGLFTPLAFALAGCPVHVFGPVSFIRDPRRFLSYLADCGGTAITGPNFSYELLADAAGEPRLTLDRWRLALNGAELVRAETCGRFTDALRPHGVGPSVMYPVYGMAEATLAVSFPPPGRPTKVVDVDGELLANRRIAVAVAGDGVGVKRLVSVGGAVHGLRLRIVDDDGQECPAGRLGEIQIAGEAVTSGYFRDSAATAAAFDGNWFRTGDLGVVLDGELFVTGRCKDMVIVNGQNYFPEDVEAVAATADGVRRGRGVAFASIDRDDGREYVAVAVEARRGTDAGELASRVRRRVAEALGLTSIRVFVVPTRWLPRTTSGKWRRAATRHMIERKETLS